MKPINRVEEAITKMSDEKIDQLIHALRMELILRKMKKDLEKHYNDEKS